MSDVIQNVRVRIMGDDFLSPVFARTSFSVSRALSQVDASVRTFADRMAAESSKAAANVIASQTQIGPAVRRVVDRALVEAKRLSQNKDVKLAVFIAQDKLDEAKTKLSQWISQSTRGARLKFGVGVEFAREQISEAKIKLMQAIGPALSATKTRIQVPIDVARDKVRAGLQRLETEIYVWKLAMSQKPAVRIAIAVAGGVKNVLSETTGVLAPLKRIAAQGIKFAITGSAAGLARAASTGLAAIRGLVSGAGSMIAGMASASVAALGPLLAILLPLGVFVGFATMAKTAAAAADANAKLADRLGATVEGLTALQYAAQTSGSTSEAVDAGLKKMTQTIGDAVNGSNSARAAFDALGLSAAELAKMPADQAFIKIADQLQKMPTAAQKASAAVDIFGKGGADLLPLLNQGAEGIAKARAEAERMGLIISRVDSAKIELANDAIARVGNTIRGYVLQAVVQIAPYIEAIAQKVYTLLPTGQQVADFTVSAIEWIALSIAQTSDRLELFKAGWYLLQAGVLAVAGGIIKAIDLIGSGLAKLISLLPGVEVEWSDTFSVMADSMAEDVIAATDKASASFDKFKSGENAAAVKKTFDEIRVNAAAAAKAAADKANALAEIQKNANGVSDDGSAAAKRVEKLTEELKKLSEDATTAGLTDAQKKIRELIDLGIQPAQLAIAQQALQTKQTIDELVGSIKGADNPWASWEKGLSVLDQLKSTGKITAEQFDAIRATLNKSLEESNEGVAKKVRESLQTPLDKAKEQIREAYNAMLSGGGFDQAKLEAYAKKVLEGVQDKARTVKIQLADGADQGMKTGVAEAAKERLALLSPMKSIDATAKSILRELKELKAKTPRQIATATSR